MTVEISRGHNPLRDPEDHRLNRIAGPSALVIFGVTGDLSRKKLMPAVYDLANRGLLPPGFALVGFARRDWEDQDFAQVVKEAVETHSRTEFREETWQQLLQGIRFVSGEFDDPSAYLFRTAMNVFRNRYRRSALGLRKTLSIAPSEDAFATIDDRDLLVRSLRELTPDQRAAVLLTGYVGLSSEEAAQMLGMRPGTVRTLATRARAAIREKAGDTR